MALPPRLNQIVEVLASSPKEFRTEVLLDYSKRIPPLPDHISADDLEQVHECQTPFFLAVEVDAQGATHLYFQAPPESPTVRGFAGILLAGLEGETPETILAVPNDFFYGMGLEEVVSPLRLRGMGAILARIKASLRPAA
ncbi:MAG: SufE family protein [Acidimicrobiia bacterium]|nr:SufE family protein [Acidimicrobiia bacterium]